MNLAVYAGLFVLSFWAVPIAASQTTPNSTHRMRQVIQNYVDNNTFMGAVLVAKKD